MKTTTPTGTYNVSKETAALLDCIRSANALYDQIETALTALYDCAEAGTDVVANEAAPYLLHVNAINEMLHTEVQAQITENLGYTKLNPEGITI